MDTKVSEIFKTMGTHMPTWKKRDEEDSPCSLANVSKFQKRDKFSKSKVELG